MNVVHNSVVFVVSTCLGFLKSQFHSLLILIIYFKNHITIYGNEDHGFTCCDYILLILVIT